MIGLFVGMVARCILTDFTAHKCMSENFWIYWCVSVFIFNDWYTHLRIGIAFKMKERIEELEREVRRLCPGWRP